jgi:dUTP pyrophosphatase
MKLRVKLDHASKAPSYATVGAAGMDILSTETGCIPAGGRKAFSTGVYLEIPQGYEVQVRSRSGLAFKSGITAFHGTIDSDYRGEVRILLFNSTSDSYMVRSGDRIAQLVLAKVERAEIEEVSSLDETDRGSGGFGSTGA